MIKTYLTLLFCVLPFMLLAQLTPLEKQGLTKVIAERVNELRIKLGKRPLELDVDLSKSAELHSNYMSKYKRLKHTQSGTNFPKPKDRILRYNKSFVGFGENILLSQIVKSKLSQADIKKLGNSMFRGWYKSPGHYANMISDNFFNVGYGFTLNKKTNRVYAAQVFAKKGFIIPNQLSDNTFSIKASDDSCIDLIGNKANIIVNLGNAVHIENGQVIFKHYNIATLKELLVNSNDGFAIDLVANNQLECDKENRFDASEVYDGIMLKPIFRDQLFAKNLANNPKRLITSLGNVPSHLKDKKLSANLIFIKSGKKCSYAVSTEIPSSRFQLKAIAPEIYSPNIALKVSGVNGIYEVLFNFKSGEIRPVEEPVFDLNNKIPHSIDIKSFTSVDGASSTNVKLHTGRATYIKTFLEKTANLENTPIFNDAKENWELCYYQLEKKGLDKVLGEDRGKIKEYIKKNSNKWKEELSEQRTSKAIVYYEGVWEKTDVNFLSYNLTDALLTNNYELANKVLTEMYLQDSNTLFLNEEFIIDKLFDKAELVQNVSALLLKNINYYELDNVVYFVRSWLSKPDLISKKAQKNLLNLYTITCRRLLSDWDNTQTDFAKVLHPEKVESLFNSYKGGSKVNPLFLNFHMSSIEYYGHTNYSPKIRESFDFIINYFKSVSKSIEDETALCLFFNSWSMYHMTINSLEKKFDARKLDEESAFLLVKTATAYQSEISNQKFLKMHKSAIYFNKKRWCNWMTSHFQNLRNEGVKNLYCKTCN